MKIMWQAAYHYLKLWLKHRLKLLYLALRQPFMATLTLLRLLKIFHYPQLTHGWTKLMMEQILRDIYQADKRGQWDYSATLIRLEHIHLG